MNDSSAVALADSIRTGMAHRTMADRISADYVVMAAAMIVWFGIFLYLLRLDRKSKELKNG